MKLFSCTNCGNILYFENVSCTQCGLPLGFLPDRLRLLPIEPRAEGSWQPVGEQAHYRMCNNYANHEVCNWMVEADSDQAFCIACALNGTIPDLSVAGNHERWRAMETEKRRLIYSMLQLGLPIVPRQVDPAGLEFAFLADTPASFSERNKVMTGHAQGLITINLAEADPAERERMREQMDEPYRTILGHFRHESGHYYWDRLIRNSHWLRPFRDLFGDETQDYAQALDQHYQDGAPPNWQEQFISAYASMHPWEDWAESWAHYLLMVDALETAYQFGLSIRPRAGNDDSLDVDHGFDAYRAMSFDNLLQHWLPLTLALNSLNRSIGHEHAYPFVLASPAIEKLRFVHRVVHEASTTCDEGCDKGPPESLLGQ
ncbi:MAG: putative zinc-binding peptidase [Chromatiaceae bacterium]|nr:putative zinc-binding peptidase [Chromatiaceae bacterium]MCF7995675.1 putative zinc-binding peptidase [Chromatiaceae bacterium]